MHHGLEPAEGIPQGKLIQRVALKVRHKASASHGLCRQRRKLSQFAPFRFGNILCRGNPRGGAQRQPDRRYGGQSHNSAFFHTAAS